jgi:hypothetical protein
MKEWADITEKEVYIPASYSGYDDLSWDCSIQIYRTLDYQVHGIWKTLFTEGEELPYFSVENDTGMFYF